MRIALKGVPENQMAMPEGIVSARIDPKTGCPARSGQRGTIFEYFREGNVPECDDVEELPDIFNDAGGIDPEPDDDDANRVDSASNGGGAPDRETEEYRTRRRSWRPSSWP